MPSFSILASDRSTGKETVLELDAPNETEAVDEALSRGLQVKKVRATSVPSSTEPAHVMSSWSPSRPRDLSDAIARGVFAGLSSMVMVVAWISFLFGPFNVGLLSAASITLVCAVLVGFDRLRR